MSSPGHLAAAEHPAANRWIGVALAGGAVLCFSLRPILIKFAYGYRTDPVTLLALRMAMAMPFFAWMSLWAARQTGRTAITRGDWWLIAGLGFVGYYFASFMDYLGLQYVAAGLGRLILFLYPTVVLLLSAAVTGAKVRRRELAALGVSYAGLALVLGRATGAHSANLPLGAALVFIGSMSYAVYLVGGTQVTRRVGSLRFSAFATTFACLLCIVQFFVLRPWSALDLPWQVYGISAIIAVLCTVFPVIMTAEALRRIGAAHVAMIGALGPVSTIFFSYLGLDETMTALQLVGVALVLGGVMLVTVKPNPG
jgi:drug/metabolite transporter (DMT)-like permease